MADKVLCPRCGAALKQLAEEKQVKPIGFGRKDKLSPIFRRHYSCGAIELVDRVYPKGTIEALCCNQIK